MVLSTKARNLKDSLYKRSSDAGPIAGGVIGGILGILLVAALVIYGWRKMQALTQRPSLTPLDELGPAAGPESRIEQLSTEAIRSVDKRLSAMPSTSILRYVRFIPPIIVLSHASSHVISPEPDYLHSGVSTVCLERLYLLECAGHTSDWQHFRSYVSWISGVVRKLIGCSKALQTHPVVWLALRRGFFVHMYNIGYYLG